MSKYDDLVDTAGMPQYTVPAEIDYNYNLLDLFIKKVASKWQINDLRSYASLNLCHTIATLQLEFLILAGMRSMMVLLPGKEPIV